MKLRTILFPTDFSETSRAALPFATQLAQASGAVLHILHVDELHDLTDERAKSTPRYAELLSALQRETGELLEGLVEQRSGGSLEIRRARRRGIAAGPEILDYATAHDMDLIVMATHGRRGLRRLVLGSVTEEVVRHSSRPVLTVRGDDKLPESQGGVLLVPVDFSEVTVDAVEMAVRLAEWTGARVEIFHVLEPPPTPVIAEGFPEMPEFPVEQLRKDAFERLEVLMADFGADKERCSARVDTGPAALTILKRIEEGDVALAILGGHGLTGFSRFLLGGVAERVVSQASSPVLTLKHPAPAGSES